MAALPNSNGSPEGVLDVAGISVKPDIYNGKRHIFQVFDHEIPEAKTTRAKVRALLDQHLGSISEE